MRNSGKFMILGGAIALLAATTGLQAAEEAKPKEEKHVQIFRADGDHPMRIRVGDDKDIPKEKVPFLGVETGRVSPTVAAQLGIPERTGLTVLRVIEGSPAEGVLQQPDILTKFNDQILVNEPQLAVLVRGAKTGDEISLTLLRAAKETKVKVKLGEHEVPTHAMWQMEGFPHNLDLGDLDGFRFEFGDAAREFGDHAKEWSDHAKEWAEHAKDMAGRVRDDVEHTLRVLSSDDADGNHVFIDDEGPMKRVTRINTNRGNIVFVDDAGRVEIKMKENGRNVLIKDKDDKVIFDGPVNSGKDRAAMSPDALKRLEQVESQLDMDYTMDKDAPTKETSIVPGTQAGGVSFERDAAPRQVRTYTL